jgi:hypothetical protein
MSEPLYIKRTDGTIVEAEGRTGSLANQARLVVSEGEGPEEGSSILSRLFQSSQFVESETLLGGASYSATAPILILRHKGGDDKMVLYALDLFGVELSGTAPTVIVALDTANRFSSGGQENTDQYCLNAGGPVSSQMEIYEAVSGSAIVATAGDGNRILTRQLSADLEGQAIPLIVPGSVVLPGQNYTLLVYAFAGTTPPEFNYRVTWAERA